MCTEHGIIVEKFGVPLNLEEAAKTFRNKNKEYGSAYKRMGKIMLEMFPDGLMLKSEEDFFRIIMMSSIIGKMNRYASNFKNGGHEDSVLDVSVMAAMLKDYDSEI